MQAAHISWTEAADLWLQVVGSTLSPYSQQVHKDRIDQVLCFQHQYKAMFFEVIFVRCAVRKRD